MRVLMFLFLTITPFVCLAETYCLYINDDGERTVVTKEALPLKHRLKANCQEVNTHLAKPDEVDLGTNVRKSTFRSEVGEIKLQWPRKIEEIFGRSPKKAMVEAAKVVKKTLNTYGFSSKVKSLNIDWNVVFLDEEFPSTQIPGYLVSNCHPGWATTPANIYIVGQRIVSGCGGEKGMVSKKTANSELMQVLLHEMGHVVEYYLLVEEGSKASSERLRAEGFASWFEMLASDKSSLVKKGKARKKYRKYAKISSRHSPGLAFRFSGSAYDYGRVAMYFTAIEKSKGISGVMKLYDYIRSNGGGFFDVIQGAHGLSREKLESEMLKQLE